MSLLDIGIVFCDVLITFLDNSRIVLSKYVHDWIPHFIMNILLEYIQMSICVILSCP